MAQRAFHFAR